MLKTPFKARQTKLMINKDKINLKEMTAQEQMTQSRTQQRKQIKKRSNVAISDFESLISASVSSKKTAKKAKKLV